MEKFRLPVVLGPFADKIDEVSDERDGDDGYWVYLVKGWYNPISETHCIHEDNPKACVAELKMIEPCNRPCCREE